ncbi:hypothetical protein [Scytonema sp. UIC 10036]|uniref:hypothetical protein n=1 Tax=Scytonema sp. UIC 10036 TaxID=2304196 RepID=UPI00325AE757
MNSKSAQFIIHNIEHWAKAYFLICPTLFYAAESIDDWMSAARFENVQTEYVGWINQVTSSVKPKALVH